MSTSNDENPFDGFKLWYYTPSIAAGAIFAVIFFILSSLHIYRLIRSRTWFCIPFVVGALFEGIGYSARAAAHSNTESVKVYVIQSVLILVAPALFAASIYMILGRIIRATRGEAYSMVRVNWVTRTFVCGDILCFFIQSGGGGLMATAKTKSQLKTYENIILGGLMLQIVIFGFFVAVAAVFHMRLRKRPTAESLDAGLPWQRFLMMLYLVSALIAIRNLFRVIEYGLGNTGYLLTHEWTLYVFDGVLMATVLGICLMWYVSNIRPRKAEQYEVQAVQQQSFTMKHSAV